MFLSRKRGLLKNKKGFLVEPLFWLIDLVLLVLVLYYSTKYIDDVAERTTFEKNFLARDLALLTEAVYISPGNFQVDYPSTTFWFSFGFEDNIVRVFEGKRVPEHVKAKYYYIEDKNLRLQKLITPAKDVEEKKPLTERIPLVRNFYAYQPELKPGTSVRLRFVRSGDFIDVDEPNETTADFRHLRCLGIGEKSAFPKDFDFARVLTQRADLREVIGGVKEGIQAIILIKYGDNADQTINNIKAYIPVNQARFAESKYIGCSIINGIIANKELTSAIEGRGLVDFSGTSVVPIDIGLTQQDKHVIILEIGNLQIEQAKNILSHETILNDAVGKSIENALAG